MNTEENKQELITPTEAHGVWYYGSVCPNCQTDNPVSNKYCGNCGVALDGSMKFCDGCDSYCSSDANFCASCGKQLGAEILSFRSGQISGNGREMLALFLSFILPGFGLMQTGRRGAGFAFFLVAVLLALLLHYALYFIIGAISFGTLLAMRE